MCCLVEPQAAGSHAGSPSAPFCVLKVDGSSALQVHACSHAHAEATFLNCVVMYPHALVAFLPVSVGAG